MMPSCLGRMALLLSVALLIVVRAGDMNEMRASSFRESHRRKRIDRAARARTLSLSPISDSVAPRYRVGADDHSGTLEKAFTPGAVDQQVVPPQEAPLQQDFYIDGKIQNANIFLRKLGGLAFMKTFKPTHLKVRDVFRINGTKSKELNDIWVVNSVGRRFPYIFDKNKKRSCRKLHWEVLY